MHLWLPQPSEALWQELRAAQEDGIVRRDQDDSSHLVRHPLLASLGRDSRELVRVLGSAAGVLRPSRLLAGARRTAHAERGTRGPGSAADGLAPDTEPRTVLGWLQADIAANRDPSGEPPREVAADDGSVQVHACHGPTRQVEVLREVLVGLLEDDPTLEPRDVLVMCPDVETYAPLIGAAFGLGEHGTDAEGVDTHPAHRLRVRLADRSLRSTNPLLDVAARLVGLAGGRLTASEVLDLAAAPPVRRRFGLDDDDLATITRWVTDAGIRWGLDAEHRAPFAMEREDQGTWRFGLDRLLLGVTMSEDGPLHVAAVMPVDDVGSGSVDLVGRLSELIDRTGTGLDAMQAARTAGEWMSVLTDAVLSLTHVPPSEQWQVGDLQRTLSRAARHATEDVPVRLADVRALLEDQLAGRPSRASFRTGGLTVCTMTPMRSVPHRVVCLLGMDDDTFPRQQTVDGDDVLARRPVTGERDARSEDRQLLLDAVLAARERLVVCYTGADEHSGERRPPAVPLSELLDAARETSTAPVEVVHHPLQPFDPRNFTHERPFSFDLAALEGARSGADPEPTDSRLIRTPLPAPVVEDVSLADLVGYFQHPGRSFLRDRLQVGVSRESDEVSDRLPIDLDGLEKWSVGDRALAARLAGRPADDVYTAELLRGDIPPGSLGNRALTPIAEQVEDLVRHVAEGPGGPPRSVDIDVSLPGGRRLTGTVDGVRGPHVVDVTFSRLGAKQHIASWLRLLALSATEEAEWFASTLGKGRGRGQKVARTTRGPVPLAAARSHLSELIDVHAIGLRAPLPLPVKTSLTWAETVHHNPTRTHVAATKAGKDWEPYRTKAGSIIPGERDDGWWRRIHGADAPFELLLTEVAGPGTDLPTLASRVWGPALDNVTATA